jgi:hypothetical protein
MVDSDYIGAQLADEFQVPQCLITRGEDPGLGGGFEWTIGYTTGAELPAT